MIDKVLGEGAFCKVRRAQCQVEMDDGSLGYRYLALKVYNKVRLMKELVHRTEIVQDYVPPVVEEPDLEEMKIPDLSALKSTDVYQ